MKDIDFTEEIFLLGILNLIFVKQTNYQKLYFQKIVKIIAKVYNYNSEFKQIGCFEVCTDLGRYDINECVDNCVEICGIIFVEWKTKTEYEFIYFRFLIMIRNTI